MRFLRHLIIGAAALLAALPAAAAERVALLIGNAAYSHATPLRNPHRDTDAMASVLRDLGFEVTQLRDLGREALGRALIDFEAEAAGADTAVLFYSGHGLEIGGANYLIPTDAALRRPRDELLQAIPLSLAVDAVSGANRLSVVIVDACRDAPPGGTRSGARGFAPVEADRPGLAIAFSTAPGNVAWDGVPGGLSPYTQALTDALRDDPAMDVRFLFTSLEADTSRHAGAPQRPFARFGSMRRGVTALAPRAAATPAPAPRPAPAPSSSGDDLSDLGDDVVTALREDNLTRLFSLGWDYDKGINGKSEDLLASSRIFRVGCDRGHGGSCSNLGFAYRHGRGVPQDFAEAAAAYGKACDNGSATGCSNLGTMNLDGRGMPRNTVRAAELYERACDAGHGTACNNLGTLFEKGDGVEEDRSRAISLYRKALELRPELEEAKTNLTRLGEEL